LICKDSETHLTFPLFATLVQQVPATFFVFCTNCRLS